MINFRLFFSEEVITDVFLAIVTNNIGNAYWQLGLLLGVARPHIQRLEKDHVGDTWRITYEVLVTWHQMSMNKLNAVAMLEDLVVALTDLHLNDVAEIVRHGECRTGPWHPVLYRCNCSDIKKTKWNVALCGNHICLIVRTF